MMSSFSMLITSPGKLEFAAGLPACKYLLGRSLPGDLSWFQYKYLIRHFEYLGNIVAH